MKRMGTGASIGTAIGFLGWLIGLAVVCVRAGEYAVLREVALPGLAVSLGAAGIVIVTGHLALEREGVLRSVLWGEVLFFVGLFILLMNHWIAPLIDASPGLNGAISGRYRTGDWLPAALMVAGAVRLGFALGRLRRQAA